jgi:uncharacterized protein (DUF2237 family)
MIGIRHYPCLGRLALLFSTLATISLAYRNVYGDRLQRCSSDGMALTGVTGTGYCIDYDDDSDSHHICIDLSAGGDFCEVTNQTSDWCDEEMPCHENTTLYCSVQNWCVCQWDFASYIEISGGCDEVQDIVCESINVDAVTAYADKMSEDTSVSKALQCLVRRCDIDVSKIGLGSLYNKSDWRSLLEEWVLQLGVIGFALGVIVMAVLRSRQGNTSPYKEQLVHHPDHQIS